MIDRDGHKIGKWFSLNDKYVLLVSHKVGRPCRHDDWDGDILLDGHEWFLKSMSYFCYVSWMVIDRDGHKIARLYSFYYKYVLLDGFRTLLIFMLHFIDLIDAHFYS